LLHPLRRVAPPLALVACAALAAPAFAADSSSEALLAKLVAAYGGQAQLDAVRSYRMTGTVLAERARAAAPMQRVLVRPDRLRVVIEYPTGSELREIDGARGWRGSPQARVPATGALLDSMRLQLARAKLPWILLERRASLGACGADASPGSACLAVQLEEGLELDAYVEPRTGLVVRAVTRLERGPLRTSFDTRFSDFRKVDGVEFAFKEENFAGGTHTAVTSVETITVNPELGEAEKP
jgi:hypothetical protein